MTKTNVQSTPSNSQHHDTPNNKTHIIKFRVTAEEKASLELTCKLLNPSETSRGQVRQGRSACCPERKPKAQFKQDTIGKLIDIQSRMTEGKGISYKRWLTKHNLKVMAQTVKLLQEKGLTDEDALNQRITELETKYHNSLAVVKDLESRMKTNKELRYYVAAYTSTKEYRTAVKDHQAPRSL